MKDLTESRTELETLLEWLRTNEHLEGSKEWVKKVDQANNIYEQLNDL